MALSLDFETRSPVDLKKHGAYVYFSHPLTDVMIASYSINDGPVRRWRWTEPCPSDVRKEIESGQLFTGHNCAFERLAINHVLAPRHGWPTLGIKQTRCTAAMAAAMGLPRALGDLGKALGLPVQKDDEGYRLMLRMSKPRMARKGEDPTAIHWYGWDDPALVERLHSYCDDDVRTEEAARKRMVPLSPEEQEVYWLSETINDRGIRIDRTSAIAALDLAEKTKARLDREMIEATGGYVTACSQVAALTTWAQGRGVAMTSAAKADIEALLECDDLPPDVRRAVELRQEAAKTSVAKLRAMLDRASSDGRVRGTQLYHGAGPGRWSNVGVNFSNMPRPRRVFEEAGLRTDKLFESIRTADPDHLIATYGPQLGRPLHLLSDAIRGFVWAAPGHDFVQADYSSIQGIVIAWLAREEWKLHAFREINADPKNTPDMYRRTAAAIMGMSTDVITKKHPLRQSVGKVSELALGFAGGVAAFATMARGYGVDLDAIHGPVWEAASLERRDRALRRYEGACSRKERTTEVLSDKAWVACEIVKVGWREQNAQIRKMWGDLEDAMRAAVREPGSIHEAGRVKYKVAMGFLWAQLPSGRCLAYGGPRLKDQVWVSRKVDGAFADAEVMDREAAERLAARGEARIDGPTSPKVTALGVNSVTKRWERFALYGGLAAENNTMGVERDWLVNGLRHTEAAGYPTVTTVYDEALAEVPRGFGSVEEFERLLCTPPAWGLDIPIVASGWRGKRYRKD